MFILDALKNRNIERTPLIGSIYPRGNHHLVHGPIHLGHASWLPNENDGEFTFEEQKESLFVSRAHFLLKMLVFESLDGGHIAARGIDLNYKWLEWLIGVYLVHTFFSIT